MNLSVQKDTVARTANALQRNGGKSYPRHWDTTYHRTAFYYEEVVKPLAIFHSHIQIISRGKGKSSVAAAAYRSGESIKNEYDGIVHDYTRKRGIVHTEILLPEHAPAEYASRAVLWNAVEKIEKADNSRLARELDIALPVELTREQNLSLIREYVKSTFVSAGMCADLCIHDTGKGNPHAHIMLTVRPFTPDGKWGGKQKKEYILDEDGNKMYDPVKRQYQCRSIPSTDWNDRGKADEWRKAWEDMANAELKRIGSDSRIDRRSYEEQGIEQVPTIHMGAAAMQMELRGIHTERGDQNRLIDITNKQIRQLRARINRVSDWLAEEAANPSPPTLYDVIDEILHRQEQSSLNRLRNAAEMLCFLQSNDITDMEDLQKKINGMYIKTNAMIADLKKVERRIGTLKEHLMHSENFKTHRKTKAQYDKLYAEYKKLKNEKSFFAERKTQKALDAANAYREEFRPQLALYNNADKYLRGVLQSRFDPAKLPPIAKWRDELATLVVGKNGLYQDYDRLKTETQKVEQFKRSIVNILHNEQEERLPQKQQEWRLQKSRGMER